MDKSKKQVFYGWLLLFALWLTMAVTIGLCHNSMGQFLKPMCEAFNMPRTTYSLLISTISVTSVVIYPVVGSLLNKHRSPWIVRIAGLLVLGGFVGLSFIHAKSLMFVMGILIGVGSAFTNMCMINIVLNNWFHAKKGFVMGFVSTGSGVGSAVFNPLASSFITTHGYQFAFRALGIIAFVLLLPLFLLYKFKPEDKGVQPYGIEPGTEKALQTGKTKVRAASLDGMTRAEALKSPTFYLLVFICFVLSMGVVGIWGHMSAYLTDIGYEPIKAASLMSLVSIVLAISKFFFGWLNDKIGTYKNYLLFTALSVVGILMTLQYGNAKLAILCSIMFGIAFSETNVMAQLITVHKVGSKHFSDIFSMISMAPNLGAMAAGPLSASVYESTGSYAPVFTIYGILYVVIFVIGVFLLRKGYGEE